MRKRDAENIKPFVPLTMGFLLSKTGDFAVFDL